MSAGTSMETGEINFYRDLQYFHLPLTITVKHTQPFKCSFITQVLAVRLELNVQEQWVVTDLN